MNRERPGDYKRFLAALADIKCDEATHRGWDCLSSAAHLPYITAPPAVVRAVMSCCKELYATKGPPSRWTATSLLIAFRDDLGMPAVANPGALDFDILPTGWFDDAA